MTTFQISSSTKSHYAVDWSCENPKAVILLVHGLGEHCRRYDHLAKFFNENRIAMVGFDQSGHGQTAGKRGHAPDMATLMDGVATLLSETKKRYPGTPVFLYGHSMGGNITLNYCLKKKPEIAGAIVTGPHIQVITEPSPLLIGAGRLINKIHPSGTQSNGLDAQTISSDPAVVQQYIDDPLVHDRISYGLAVALIDGAHWLNQYSGAARMPILLMHGSTDKITSPKASSEFAKRITSSATYKEWEGFFHEIHNEKEQEKVFTFTLNWILERLKL